MWSEYGEVTSSLLREMGADGQAGLLSSEWTVLLSSEWTVLFIMLCT